MRITILLSALILAGCAPSYHLKRAEYHLKKAEIKGAVITPDTVFIDHPVFIEEVKRDSIFFSLPGDTVRIEKDRLRVTYVRLPGDSVYIEGECQADTVYKEVPVTITNTIESPSKIKLWWLFVVLAIGIFFGWIKTK